MKITFLGYKDNSVNIFPGLAKVLSKKISGLELEERFVPFAEDIPIVALEASEESDFIFVFALLDDEEMADFIKKKLIDVEIGSKTRILKVVDSDEFSGMDEEEYLDKKDKLILDFSDLIVKILFNEESFLPKDKDFSL
ncbi:MAG: hypothetical protein WCW44_02225 [archaeon]|jgi:hypothetical protein